MRLFVLGAPCSGKSTIARLLANGSPDVIDVDDEIVRLNGGSWPDIDTKNERLLPQVLEDAAARPNVVMFNSYMPMDRTRWLKQQRFEIALLDVPEAELRRRHAVRLTDQGWTNIEWFDWHQAVVRAHVDENLIDHVIDCSLPVVESVATLAALLDRP